MANTKAEPTDRAMRAAEEIFRNTDNVRAAAEIIDRAIAEALGGRAPRAGKKVAEPAPESECGCRWHRANAAARAGAGR